VLTAGANWSAEPIRGGGKTDAINGDEAHKPGRPAETQFETLVCKKDIQRREERETESFYTPQMFE